ncbi:MAG: ribonuclease HII [Nevskiaceae bacterium]|nr:MAG: ribonuclease HII [Nevskiaceae bacterium]TBR72073.1 MAG: ribonuclease HII [Nevskiaceae bacterium]
MAGIDEVGRGCLAGPVYAAAVILPLDCALPGLRDSKQLSPRARERLVPRIEAAAVAWAIGIASVEEIDRVNILQATFLAMQRAVAALAISPVQCLVDGNRAPPLAVPVRTIVGGDHLEPAIMAASVIAKVARDAELVALDARYPGYGLAHHKGYGTAQHLRALEQIGPCVLHRMTFAPCRRAAAGV